MLPDPSSLRMAPAFSTNDATVFVDVTNGNVYLLREARYGTNNGTPCVSVSGRRHSHARVVANAISGEVAPRNGRMPYILSTHTPVGRTETQIMRLLAEGNATADIAHALCLPLNFVEALAKTILRS